MRYAAGFLLALAAACSQDLSSPAPTRSPSHHAAHLQPARELPQIGLVDPGGPSSNSSARRNVFAYPAPAQVVALTRAQPVVQPPVAAVVTPPSGDVVVPLRQPFAFPYRYIGRFGPENGQLAAFVADGEATVVRTGEVLAGKFLVKAIGLDSVEVALLSAPEQSRKLDVGQ